MSAKRAAHRPSRKHAIVDAALRLYASVPREQISVLEIAAEANMTAAALYYHYPTKEDVLLEGLTAFAETLIHEVTTFLRGGGGTAGDLPRHLIDWLDANRIGAMVWFARSDGLSTAVEACRRATNERLLTEIVRAVRITNPEFPLPHASVVGAALLGQIEVSARAWLTDDVQCVAGQEDEFRSAVAELGVKIAASPVPS